MYKLVKSFVAFSIEVYIIAVLKLNNMRLRATGAIPVITFEQYQTQVATLYTAMDTTAAALKELTEGNRGAMGLVSEETRTSEAYKAANSAHAIAFQAVRKFNQATPNEYKRRNRKYK